jgi:recombination protein RecA
MAHEVMLAGHGVQRGLAREARALPEEDERALPAWAFDRFVGRLGEVSSPRAGAALTLAFRVVLEAQRRGEPVAWIEGGAGTFYPPDAAEGGVDVEALIVVRAADPRRAVRAADWLLRSGGFGLVVLDVGERASVPLAVQGRLGGLAGRHRAAVVCLTGKESERPSLGSLVGVRLEAARRTTRAGPAGFACEARVLKDKGRGPVGVRRESYRGPAGLC